MGHDVDGGEIVVDDDALGRFFQGEHLEFLGKVHRHALGLLKADVGVAFQVRLRHLVQLGEGMALADKDAGGHSGQFVEGQVPGVQQMADDLLRHLGEENDAHICPVLVDIGNDLFHAGVLDGVLVMVVRNVIQHFQERVVGKEIALAALWTAKMPNKWLAPLPPVLCNAVIIGAMIAWYECGFTAQFPALFAWNAFTVGLGEAIACYVLGLLLLAILPQIPALRGRLSLRA